MPDGFAIDGYPDGLPLHETVELYADNQEQWMEDFVRAWDKMTLNGVDESKLTKGPNDFWLHMNNQEVYATEA